VGRKGYVFPFSLGYTTSRGCLVSSRQNSCWPLKSPQNVPADLGHYFQCQCMFRYSSSLRRHLGKANQFSYSEETKHNGKWQEDFGNFEGITQDHVKMSFNPVATNLPCGLIRSRNTWTWEKCEIILIDLKTSDRETERDGETKNGSQSPRRNEFSINVYIGVPIGSRLLRLDPAINVNISTLQNWGRADF